MRLAAFELRGVVGSRSLSTQEMCLSQLGVVFPGGWMWRLGACPDGQTFLMADAWTLNQMAGPDEWY
ncbi:MAG: hypothetical protein HY713_12860 [candidate division NC10 bacterium]|nr:hypothetical protein [candidate division NC10 bacterium]